MLYYRNYIIKSEAKQHFPHLMKTGEAGLFLFANIEKVRAVALLI